MYCSILIAHGISNNNSIQSPNDCRWMKFYLQFAIYMFRKPIWNVHCPVFCPSHVWLLLNCIGLILLDETRFVMTICVLFCRRKPMSPNSLPSKVHRWSVRNVTSVDVDGKNLQSNTIHRQRFHKQNQNTTNLYYTNSE